MITLPNNCRVGKFSIYPENWSTKKAKANKAWRVTYWFYDDNVPDKKQIRFQGMNSDSINYYHDDDDLLRKILFGSDDEGYT